MDQEFNSLGFSCKPIGRDKFGCELTQVYHCVISWEVNVKYFINKLFDRTCSGFCVLSDALRN